jgi:preprotein translocase subunit SecE
MNRQTKRMMAKQGTDKPAARAPGEKRRPPSAAPKREKIGPKEYLSEVKGELRKVAWPPRRRSSTRRSIVLIAVVVMTTLIFGFDYASSKFVLFLFDGAIR